MYTKYSVSIELATSSVRQFPSKEKKSRKKRFFPFKKIRVNVKETYICPICGKEIPDSKFACSCKDFEPKLKKLQESHQDFNHKSELHYDMLHPQYVYSYSIESLNVKLLGDEKIKELGPDVWDEATRVSDSGYSYLIAKASYKNKKASFLCKDVQTKKVYQCTTEEFDVSADKIYLGVWHQKTVSHGGNKIGNYHFEHYWNNIATFENWDQLCRVIQAM